MCWFNANDYDDDCDYDNENDDEYDDDIADTRWMHIYTHAHIFRSLSLPIQSIDW